MTNTTTMQAVQASANAVAMGTTRQQAYAGTTQSLNDPFGAIIAQMLMQTQQGQQGQDATLLDALMQQAGQASDSDKQKLEQMLAQGASALLQMPQAQSSGLLSLLQGGAEDTQAQALGEVGAANTAAADAAQELSALAMQMSQGSTLAGLQNTSTVSQEVLEALQQMHAGTPQAPSQQNALSPSQNEASADTTVGAVPVEIAVQQTAESGKADTAFSQLMHREAETEQAAKAQTTEDTGKGKATEAFSQAVAVDAAKDTARPTSLSETQMAKAEELSREPELLQQLEKSINETLSTGKQELTMKLKPEALGEITVRLVEREGKMTLDITAANAQTAKLINSDLTALREAVRPMNVEVHEAVQQSGTASQGTAQYDLFGQQFSGQQQFANQQAWQQAAARNARRTDSFEDTVQQVSQAQTTVQSAAALSALDTYV